MNDNLKEEFEEKVNETVEEMKEKIDEISSEANKVSGKYAEKAKELSDKATDVLKQASNKLQEVIKDVQDPEEVQKVIEFVKSKSKTVYDASMKKLNEFLNSKQVQTLKEDGTKLVKDAADKTTEVLKDAYDKAMENPNVKDFADNVNKVYTSAKNSVNDFLEKPEVQEKIDKAKDVTIDVAEKAVAALKEWLKPDENKKDDNN